MVPITVKVEHEWANELEEHIGRLKAAHDREVGIFRKRAALRKDTEQVFKENADLMERGKRITTGNLVRAVLRHGMAWLDKVSDTEVLAELARTGIPMGRPREARRGR